MNAAQSSHPVRFVLIEPQRGGNIGAAARALKNLGFSRLEIVRPACDPRGSEARRMAVSAVDLLETAGVHENLEDALCGAQTVVGTSARTGKQRQPHWRIDAFVQEHPVPQQTGETAWVFGREDHGLSDMDLDRCTHIVYLPADDAYTSFNLSQAVLLVAWELRRAWIAAPELALDLASDSEREAYYTHLEEALRAIGFVTDQTAPSILRRLRRIYGRAAVSAEELATLRGLARQILWAARQAGR